MTAAESRRAKPKSRLVHPETRALLKDFTLDASGVFMPDEAFGLWQDRVRSVARTERKTRATELLAVAFKFHRKFPGSPTERALRQLTDLTAILLGSK